MKFPRRSGVLLHPTSLPGPYGIGDLGPEAHRWLEWLAAAGQTLWQVLPLGPTGYGDSPYQCFSSFAGNPYLVSPQALIADGLLTPGDLADAPRLGDGPIDFGPVIEFKVHVLARAFERFATQASPALRAEYDAFGHAQAAWLDDFALFMALKEAHGGRAWMAWAPELALRDGAALAAARTRLAGAVESQRFRQFVFRRQWQTVRAHAHELGIALFGDMPIFVAHDSADVWAHPGLFHLDARGERTVVAGVPPDYFSTTGQLWGNPLYRWDVLARDGYRWWIERVRATLETVDLVRLDHFRGFEAYWEVPADRPTAEVGRWVKGPGVALFEALRAALGDLPMVAEDLGVVTPEVEALRDTFDLPGMKILQFAFGGDTADPFLPHNFTQHCAAYTGTHDNDTARGWYEVAATERERDFARRYLGRDGSDFAWDLTRAGMASVAHTFVVPLQDVLNLGVEARMNLPGRPAGNWGWRYRREELGEAVGARLAELTALYGRSRPS